MSDDWPGPRCLCGEWVAVIHAECRAMLTADHPDYDEAWRP